MEQYLDLQNKTVAQAESTVNRSLHGSWNISLLSYQLNRLKILCGIKYDQSVCARKDL